MNIPILAAVPEHERRERNTSDIKQCIMSIGHEEWKVIFFLHVLCLLEKALRDNNCTQRSAVFSCQVP